MKTLYLVRHAKSSWKYPHLADIDRPLNKRGKRDAPFMGKLLQGKGIVPDVMITSGAVRTELTAAAFVEATNYPLDKLLVNEAVYDATVIGMLEVVKGLKGKWNSAMIFGHNFSYTMFANLYAKPPLDNVPTCGMVAIEFGVDSWSQVTKSNGKVIFFEYPRKYFPKKNK
jgi:phosphohistidine phosphatase